MHIKINEDYNVVVNTAMLGYVGETNARPVSVEGMEIDGADRYVLTIDYGDGVQYEVDITGGQWTPTADILRSAQTVSCQIAAKKLSGQEYILVKKSRIFRLRIGAAIGDTAIPSPDVAMDALDKIDAIGRQAHADMQTAVTAAGTATTAAENAEKSATAAEKSADTATQAASRAETAKTAAETSAQTAQAVADSLPDDYTTAVGKIAENTAEIGRVKLSDKELQRRVNALYDMENGITHQFETDTDTAYAKTVPTGAKLMSVKNIGGRSIVWNQLISQIVEKTSNGIATTKIDSKSLHISGTSSAVCFIPISPVQTGISNHKYLFHSHASDTTALSSGTGFYNDNGGNRWHEYGKGIIFTMDGNGTIAIAFRVNSNITVDFSITPQIYDLTAMFGSGNEPASVEEFEKMFPADYYPYNAGEIVSAGTEEFVEHGRNLWDEVWGVGSINASSGNNEFSKEAIYSKTYTPIAPNSTHIFVYAGSAKFENVKTRFYDYNKNYIGYNDKDGQTVYPNKKFITPSDAFYVRFTLPPSYGNAYKNDIALIAGSSGSYAPYHSNVYQIPEAIKALPGYGVEGNAVDYEAKTYTQNNTVDGTEIKALDTPIVTDISTMLADDFLRNVEVEAGGSVTFKNSNGDSYRIPVPNEEEYIVKLSEVGGTT
ncbi:hypothetical protein [Ruminococcus sp.]|uniref:hypothetical protein n=1 Tax=Ruminococcus sp. TaxID=41978 RepID=UPI003AB88DC8